MTPSEKNMIRMEKTISSNLKDNMNSIDEEMILTTKQIDNIFRDCE